jgi:hypothetical protein
MPNWKIGDRTVRRKNLYLPCAVKTDGLSDEEAVAVLKAAYWADNITNAEWPVVLGRDDGSPAAKSARSRLKKKGAGWLVALGRIDRLNPDLYDEMVKQAEEMYRDQVGAEHPFQWGRETLEAVRRVAEEKGDGERLVVAIEPEDEE